jgi:uncharacterized membrane protein
MSNLVVIAFDEADEAEKVLHTLRSAGSEHLSTDDVAVVVKDEDGKVHVHNEVDRGVKIGALGGGFLGVLIAGLFFPVGGLILGVLGGALVGKLAGVGIEDKFVKEVSEQIQPGNSALFIIIRDTDPTFALAALRPYKGTLLHASLDADEEEEVRRVLKKRM